MLDRDGHVVLTDFGLSRQLLDGRTHSFCGTVEYMAPEIIQRPDNGYNHLADFYSLGVVIFELLCGQPPYRRQETESNREFMK